MSVLAPFTTRIKTNLDDVLQMTQMINGIMMTGDNRANRIIVELYNSNGRVRLDPAPFQAGTSKVVGYFIRGDGYTVEVDGTVNEQGEPTIVIPSAAYISTGALSIAIRILDEKHTTIDPETGDEIITWNSKIVVAALSCFVQNTETDSIVDPDHHIPDVQELLAYLDRLEQQYALISQAEGLRVIAEQGRVAAESDRESAELNRESRVDAATAKIENMTVSAIGLAAGSAPTVTITDVNGHKHITFGLAAAKDFHINHTFSSIAEMQAYTQADLNDYAMIDTGSVEDPETGRLYCWESDNAWHYVGDLSGAQGIKGEPGTGIANVVLNQDYTLTITLTNGQTMTTSSIRGAQGPKGNPGQNGNDGANAYVHIRYAAQQPTSDSDIKTTPDEWIGLYSGTSATAPTTYTSYTWYKFKGETGIAENIYGTTVPMSPTDSTKVASAVQAAMTAASEKYTKPASGIPATDIADGVIPGVMTGSTAQAAGTAGLVPAPTAGSQSKALFGDGTWKEVADPSDMTGASQSAAGAHGLVPAPAAGDQDKALFGDGTWKTVSVEDPDDFTGATASTAGAHGLVPAPAAGDQTKVLTGDGTWKVSPGAKVYEKTVTVTNTSGAYSQTFTDENISADMKAVELEVNRSFVFGDSIIVTPNDGSVTVACNDVAGTDTIKISLIKVIDDPTAVTSTEFTILNNRLLAVENVCTDTNIVIETTDWEQNSGVYEYTWESSIINSACSVEVMLRDGSESSGLESFEFEKVAGGVKFTADILATGDLPLTVRVINAKADAFQTLTASDIYTEAVTGADNVEEALTAIVEDISDNSQAIANIPKLKYMDLTDTTPMNVNSKSGGAITVDNFVGCASRTSGAMPLPYYNNTVQYIKLVNFSDYSAFSGSVTVRVWYI